MSIFKPVKFYKEDVLPTGNQLMPNALYFIKVGEEFDLYVTTNTTPVVAKRIVPGSTPVESGHIILWNGVEVTPRSKLNFRGFTLTDREELDEIEVEFNPEETLEGSPEDTDTLAILTQDVSDDDDDDDSSGEKGWLKITWANIKSTLKTYFDSIYPKLSGGGFIANVYFRADSSEVEGYKRISYLNELVPTELAITINNADGVTLARTYLYDDALETTILDAGVYIANYRVKVDTDNKETYLIFQAFVRHLNGEETVLFSSEGPEINNTAYTTIRHESNQPNFTVLSTDRFGVRIYARTTRVTDVTINTIVGGEHASYFSTPIALRHSLTRGRDLADQHPASAIAVSDPVTPDYTAAVQGNNLQQVTNKVAGMQLQSGGKVNALGSITGVNEINLSNGTFITATLTGAIELSFTGLPAAGYVKDFVLLFTNIETITFPTGTKFAGGVPPVVIASPYMFVCSVDSVGVVTVYSLIDNIIVPM